MWKCDEGHIRISPAPINPFFPVNGTRDFDGPYFTVNTNLVGEMSAFFTMKNKLINCVHPDEPCQHYWANMSLCDKRKHQYEELIISWLTLLIFEVTGDVDSYNSSEHLNFPLNLNYNNDGIGSIRYNLTARAFSTTSSGTHFYAKIIHNNVVYRYYDLKSQGVVSIESKDPNSLSGKHSNSVLVAYDLCEEEASTRFSNNCIEIFLEKLSNFEIEIPKEKSTSAIYCDAKVIENKERIVRRSKRIKTENKS
ncbi:13013_t:CDS:2 [Entrophospora sp. SA101]|nr:20097_t:CDS:2 [Entrophospora sp. SA101]CAJ0838039.1 13013_t:CDS:2 [Entrophospora sp. SA101]CAJ0925475.1 16777_t:CDS:2 [Entrophospora sp. SA101]